MKRTDLLNFLADRFQLEKYLEIGVQDPSQNFNSINISFKISVDPNPNSHPTFCSTSDEFFESWPLYETIDAASKAGPKLIGVDHRFDLIFIDGLHHADQVRKDFNNATKALLPGGFIVLHDCNPLEEWHTIVPRPTDRGHWNGDVYRFASLINHNIKATVDIDNGCMVVRPDPGKPLYSGLLDVSWQSFDKIRKELLNLVSWNEFISGNLPYLQ